MKIFWLLFYILTGLLLLLFFLNDKKITSFLNNLIDENYKINVDKKDNEKFVIGVNIVSVIAMLGAFVFFVDKTPSTILPLKTPIMLLAIGISVILFLLNKKKEYITLIDFILAIAGAAFFGIYDVYFKAIMIFGVIMSLISVILETEQLKERLKFYINSIFLIFLIFIIQNHYLGNYNIPTQSMEPTILAGDRIFSNNILYKFKDPSINDIISFSEPLENKVMYTKRITGVSGTIFNIKDNKVLSDGKEISERYYSFGQSSLYNLIRDKIYIPKKGDKVTISQIVEYDFENGVVNLLDPKGFLETYKGQDYRKLIGIFNNSDLKISKRYSFLMKAEGVDEIMLPILDFKYSSKLFEKLLSGESVTLKENYYMAMGDNTDNSQDSRYFGYVSESRIKGRLFFRWYPMTRIGIVKDEF